jgi:hypothetical protein
MKETRFPIRTTDEEKARWFDAAKHTPFDSTSAWARFVLNQASSNPALFHQWFVSGVSSGASTEAQGKGAGA